MIAMHPLSLGVSLLLLLSWMSPAFGIPPPVFDKTLVVANITKCPKKNVMFDKKDFNMDDIANILTTLQTGNVSQTCQDEAVNKLAGCFDSLPIRVGCCAKECADGLDEVRKSGCFASYAKAICEDPEAASVRTGLLYAAKRCINYEATCQNATAKANTTAKALPPAAAVNATSNSTAKATAKATANTTADGVANSTALAEAPSSAAAPAAATPSPAPGTKPNGAASTLMSPWSLLCHTLTAMLLLMAML